MTTLGRERRPLRERGVDVALEHLFQGSALNAVDAKGRVSIPAFLRGVVERRGDARTIVLAKHEAFPCLSAYDPAYAALKHAKLERLLEKEETSPDAQLEYQQRNLMAFAATEETPYDSSGRILMPPMMRRKGQIGDLALPPHHWGQQDAAGTVVGGLLGGGESHEVALLIFELRVGAGLFLLEQPLELGVLQRGVGGVIGT